MAASRLRAVPLAVWERDALKAALIKSGLPAQDVDGENRLFWRFERHDDMPVGFGGLEIHGRDALLRSVVTLPPLRNRGFGSAIVAALENEAQLRKCRAIYVLTTSATEFLSGLGYASGIRDDAPEAIRASPQFTLCPSNAALMVKHMG